MDFFSEEMSQDAFLLPALSSLFEILLKDTCMDTTLQRKTTKLLKMVEKRFELPTSLFGDFAFMTENDLPTVVTPDEVRD